MYYHLYIFFLYATLFLCITSCFIFCERSIHRPTDLEIPQITAYWDDKSPHHTIRDSHLKEYPIFKITAESSYQYLIPDTPITFSTNATKKVTGALLKDHLEIFLQEIQEGLTNFTYFTILRDKDYNATKRCGFIIAKHKFFPFVAKLSIERPETFVDPFCKGIIPMYFFFMAGGSNRHMTGLTRILNLHKTNQALVSNPKWCNYVKTPRKWFWLPEKPHFFYVTGKNIGTHKKTITTKLPSVYAIIADAIDTAHEIPLPTKLKNKIIIQLCNDLNLRVDPHEDNFVFLIDPITGKVIIVIVDTEHFLTMVGINEKQQFTGHTDFYLSLAKKCARDIFLCTKDKRLQTCWYSPEVSLF